MVYAAGQEGAHRLYLMNADGSNPQALTTQGDDTEPNWSPDRHTIIYTVNRTEGPIQLAIINADGSNEHLVTNDGGYAGSWSPDGQHIAFISDRKGGAQLFVMNADGSNTVQLTTDPNSEATETTWSPDGQVTFVYNKSGSGSVWLINVDGSNAHQLTHDANGNVAGPSWSPDGKRLGYALTINGDTDILTSDQSGSNGTQIVTLSGKYADNVTWSPDGKQLAFMVWEKKKAKSIFVVAADRSGNLQQLSSASSDDAGWPSWGSLKPTAPTANSISGQAGVSNGGNSCLILSSGNSRPVTPTDVQSIIPPLGGVVLEITQVGGKLNARAAPSSGGSVLRLLYWGDRVLWKNEKSNGFLKVYLGNGQIAYIVDNPSYYTQVDPTSITPGLYLGAQLQVNNDGNNSHLRSIASTGGTEAHTARAGEMLTVVGGPCYSEYYIWWQLKTSGGITGWHVDLPQWWQ
jgi:Tol biopolymer transport system component